MDLDQLVKLLNDVKTAKSVADRDLKSFVDRLEIDAEKSPFGIGGGAIGTVFKFKYKKGNWAAMKVVDNPKSYRRMMGGFKPNGDKQMGEAEILTILNGVEGVVQKIEGPYKLDTDTCFVVLELGKESLHSLIWYKRQDKIYMPADEINYVGLQVCGALERAHEKKIVHRDINSRNVIIFPDSDPNNKFGYVVKLCDWSEAGFMEFKSTLVLRGYVPTLAPEVLRDASKSKEITAENYSVGCLLFHMTTNELLYTEEDLEKRIGEETEKEIIEGTKKDEDKKVRLGIRSFAELKEDPKDLKRRLEKLDSAKNCPKYLRTIIERCVDPDSSKRYQTTQELINALSCYGDYRKSYDSLLVECKKTWTGTLAPIDLIRQTKQAYAQLMASYQQSGLSGDKEAERLLAKAEKEYNAFAGRVMKGVNVYFPFDSPEPNALEKTKQHLVKLIADENSGITPQSLAEIRNQCLDITDVLGT